MGRAFKVAQQGASGDAPYVLYGAYASFYTAKTRSYLRKKGVRFIERLPSHPRFRETVSPAARSRRIPILEAPDGTVVQDTTEIFEHLEARFPNPPALPPGPRQRLAAYLVDLFASEALKIAWHYRWNFREENYLFVSREFGRSFKPQGTNAELDHYGEIIARRMDGHRARMGVTPDLYPAMDAIYFDLLDTLEEHFTTQPYFFGGLPSIGDFALMAPLFGHLGRDPYPLHLMQRRSPRVFRWVEHMNTPEIQSPEFAETPMDWLPGDAVPPTVVRLLGAFVEDHGPWFLAAADLWRGWVADHPDRPPGSPVSDQDEDQPGLGQVTVPLRGRTITHGASGHSLWLLQRTLRWLAALPPDDRRACDGFAGEIGARELLAIDLARPLTRVGNRLAVA
ncbi:MAG TPA: glutathione S-transferase N-terminal domain-containing protein [Phenylobacterium sp.]|nr:glutathione S-transferase N-terminal domain-containing protein [Phenylobacterium sp.]